jgi:hypothetical protein
MTEAWIFFYLITILRAPTINFKGLRHHRIIYLAEIISELPSNSTIIFRISFNKKLEVILLELLKNNYNLDNPVVEAII